MFSHFVTAAKGLFARPNSEEASSIPSDSTPNNPKMVTATRQRNIPSREATAGSDANSTPVMNGKRKTRPANSGTADGQHKRRKRSSLEGPEAIENGDSGVEESEPTPKKKREGSPSKHNHVRFDSEEPDEPQGLQAEEIQEPQGNKNDSEDSSDDDAPEAIDNSAQMSRIKAESQKLQKVKQREEQLKKEKRRQLDERRKLQANLASKKLDAGGDDLVSESTETLQGSTTQDSRRQALPALLPDEILNAAPAERPPTPPAEETGTGPRKPNKLKFLDKVEKAPKDVKMGDVTIRVLDEPSSGKMGKPALPPKASKVGRNSKDNWLKSNRSTARVNGLRRTAGGTVRSSFVRK